MNCKTIALSCLMLCAATGCAHRVVYTESYDNDPVVVRRTVVVNSGPRYHPHYYHRRPYEARVVVVSPRSHNQYHGGNHREWARRDDRSAGPRADIATPQANVPTQDNARTSVNTNVHSNVHTNVHTNIHANVHGNVRVRAEASAR